MLCFEYVEPSKISPNNIQISRQAVIQQYPRNDWYSIATCFQNEIKYYIAKEATLKKNYTMNINILKFYGQIGKMVIGYNL